MGMVILRAAAWATISVGVALFVTLVPKASLGITSHLVTEGEYLRALAPLEIASAASLLLLAIGSIRSGVFQGPRRIAFWLAVLLVVGFWVSFYADLYQGLFQSRLTPVLFS